MQGHINITGGEPLCNPYFFKILDLIKKDKDLISFSILSNGTLITDEIAKKIKSYNPYYVQVSLEGGKKTNDYIRGTGTYKKIAQGIINLRNNDIFTSISFTATNLNYKEFPKVVKYARKYNVNNVWTDRYIPLGGSEDKNLALTYNQTREYLEILNKERQKLLKKKNNITTISMYRALQFQMTNDFAYGCTAGDTLLTVMENGDLVPCRRMPIPVGNLLKDNMTDLYFNNKILKDLRKKSIPEDCSLCEHSETCHGGLKCLTYAIYKDLNHKDVGCNL
jgi:radical SAM protein with 4Fe4S-binding SPASM domain